MTASVSVRPMTEADRDVWAEMYHALFPTASLTALHAEIARILVHPVRAGFCAETDGAIIGFAEYNVREFANGCESQPVPFLEGLWVRPEHRRKGVARALINHLSACARAAGHSEMGSDVDLLNLASQTAHTCMGFEETERVVYYRKVLSDD